MSSTELAQVGSPPAFVPLLNTVSYIFSNPFHAQNDVIRSARTQAMRAHGLREVNADKPLLVDSITGEQLTWNQARQDALRVAAGLHSLGLQPAPLPASYSDAAIPPPVLSPIVLLHLPNSLPFAPLLFGIIAAGLTASMANPALTATELAWILQNARPEVVVTTREGLATLHKAVESLEGGERKDAEHRLFEGRKVFIIDAKGGSASSSLQARDWKDLLSSQPLEQPFSFHNPQEARRRTAVVLWSSGTSGKSKGVLVSHAALNASLLAMWHISPSYGGDERWLGFVPFYHVFGIINVLLLSVCIGGTVVAMPRFDPKKMVELVQRHRITFLHLAPPVAVLLAKSPLLEGADFRSVKGGVSGGAPLAPELIGQVHRRLGFVIAIGYGLSETGSVAHQIAGTWDDLKPQLGSAGWAVEGVQLKIVSIGDEANQKTLKRDEEGEIVVKSPAVMSCYMNNPSATSESLDSDGWFRTGDIGKIDRSGRLWITDRLKEVIKVKGFQVSPSDLEGILCGSDAVADAAVVGIYDEKVGSELPRAYVVPRNARLVERCQKGGEPTPELRDLGMALKKLVEAKAAHYKRLRGDVIFLTQIPKSPAGKILRRLLKDQKGVQVCLYPEQPKAKL